MKHYKNDSKPCLHQDEKERKRKRKAERSHKDSSSESTVNSDWDEVLFIVAFIILLQELTDSVLRAEFSKM